MSNVPDHVAMAHSERVLKIVRSVPKNGGSRLDLPPELWLKCHLKLKSGGYYDAYGRMSWDTVAPTLTSGCTNPSKGRFIHPEQDRGITPREAARLQTFPDWFVFNVGPTVAAYHIGNAWPPLFAYRVASALPLDSSRGTE